MQSPTSLFHSSPAQENAAGLPLFGEEFVGYQEIGFEQSIEERVLQLAAYEAVSPAQLQHQQLNAFEAVTPVQIHHQQVTAFEAATPAPAQHQQLIGQEAVSPAQLQHQQMSPYGSVSPTQIHHDQLTTCEAVTPAPAQRLTSGEDKTVLDVKVKEPNASDSFITLKYVQTATPPSEQKMHLPAPLGPTMTKRKRDTTKDQPRNNKKRNSGPTPADISAYQSIETAAVERMRKIETENRKLLFVNDQHKLNVTALQEQVKNLQQKNAQLEHEKLQLRSYIAALPPTADSTPKSIQHSLTPGQKKTLNAMEVHQRILTDQSSALPSPPQERSSPSSNILKRDLIDLKTELAAKKDESKKLRKQNKGLSTEVASLHNQNKTLFSNNEQLANSVVRFAKIERKNHAEIVGLRQQVTMLQQEVTRLNDAAHGVVEVQDFQGFWSEHGHPPPSASFWQQQFHDVGNMGTNMANYDSAQFGSDSGIGEMLATPEQHRNRSDSGSGLVFESIEHGDKQASAEDHLANTLLHFPDEIETN